MRLLITATSLRPSYGGPAYSVSSLANALAAAGAQVALWTADGSATDTDLLADAVRRLDGPLGQAAAFGPDVIHDNGLWLAHNHAVAGMARALGVARIVSTRGMLEPWALRHKAWKKRLAWRLYQRGDLDRAAMLHATAEPEAATLAALRLAAPVTCIPNGVDLPDSPAPSPTRASDAPRTALFLGRLYPVKGLPMLIEAWTRLRPPGWRLVIAGPDEAGHRRELEAAIAAADVGGSVSFAGAVTGAAKAALFREADLFVAPSHSESFGIAIAEALAHGLPVLTTTAAPWPLLEQRGCGWRVAPDARALTDGLRLALAGDTENLRAMGDVGRRLVADSYGWEGVGGQFLALYEQLRAGRSAARPVVAA